MVGWLFPFYEHYLIMFHILNIIHAKTPMISNPQILTIKSKGHKQNIIPTTISHSNTLTAIPLVIGFQIRFFIKNETVLTNPASANSAKSAYIKTPTIFCIKPSLCIQALWLQKRLYPPSIVIYNANNVPIIRNEPISVL